jgi:hypothetical protein
MGSTHSSFLSFLTATWPLWFLGLWAFWNATRDSKDEKLVKRSVSWPEAQGKVTATSSILLHMEMKYEYVVAGNRYEGKYKINLNPTLARTHSGLNRETNQNLRNFYPGKSLVIRYNPQEPEESVFYRCGEMSLQSSDQPAIAAPDFVVLK